MNFRNKYNYAENPSPSVEDSHEYASETSDYEYTEIRDIINYMNTYGTLPPGINVNADASYTSKWQKQVSFEDANLRSLDAAQALEKQKELNLKLSLNNYAEGSATKKQIETEKEQLQNYIDTKLNEISSKVDKVLEK